MKGRVGFIGLGAMGLPMAKRIAANDFALSVFDVDTESVKNLIAEYPAVQWEASVYEIGVKCDAVITMLPDAATVKTICAGRWGLFAGMQAGKVWIDMTTCDPFNTSALVGVAS